MFYLRFLISVNLLLWFHLIIVLLSSVFVPLYILPGYHLHPFHNMHSTPAAHRSTLVLCLLPFTIKKKVYLFFSCSPPQTLLDLSYLIIVCSLVLMILQLVSVPLDGENKNDVAQDRRAKRTLRHGQEYLHVWRSFHFLQGLRSKYHGNRSICWHWPGSVWG